jgi:hypothetical protein
MSQSRLSVHKIREVLRLHGEDISLSNRAIARACNIAASTVGEYLHRAKDAGLAWPLPEDLTEEELFDRIFPEVCQRAMDPIPDWSYVHRELKRRGVKPIPRDTDTPSFVSCIEACPMDWKYPCVFPIAVGKRWNWTMPEPPLQSLIRKQGKLPGDICLLPCCPPAGTSMWRCNRIAPCRIGSVETCGRSSSLAACRAS